MTEQLNLAKLPEGHKEKQLPPEQMARVRELTAEIKALQTDSPDMSKIRAIYQELKAIYEPEPEFTLEGIPDLKEQYQSQVELLDKLGLLETLSSGQKGIRDIQGNEQPLPTLQELAQRLSPEKKALLERKAEQGLVKLLLVPFGLSLDQLIETYQNIIKDHFVEDPTSPIIDRAKPHLRRADPARTKLLATDGTALDLDTNEPLWLWEKYPNADQEEKLVYFPKKFDKDHHQGQTKEEIIEQGQAWQLLLVEDLPDLPAQNNGLTIAGRRQLESNQTGHEYLRLLQEDPQYQGEQGLTPEAQIIRSLTYLEEKNQVVDDWQGQGKVNWLLGAWFSQDGLVPDASWDRGGSQADLDGGGPGARVSDGGALPSVTI